MNQKCEWVLRVGCTIGEKWEKSGNLPVVPTPLPLERSSLLHFGGAGCRTSNSGICGQQYKCKQVQRYLRKQFVASYSTTLSTEQLHLPGLQRDFLV